MNPVFVGKVHRMIVSEVWFLKPTRSRAWIMLAVPLSVYLAIEMGHELGGLSDQARTWGRYVIPGVCFAVFFRARCWPVVIIDGASRWLLVRRGPFSRQRLPLGRAKILLETAPNELLWNWGGCGTASLWVVGATDAPSLFLWMGPYEAVRELYDYLLKCGDNVGQDTILEQVRLASGEMLAVPNAPLAGIADDRLMVDVQQGAPGQCRFVLSAQCTWLAVAFLVVGVVLGGNLLASGIRAVSVFTLVVGGSCTVVFVACGTCCAVAKYRWRIVVDRERRAITVRRGLRRTACVPYNDVAAVQFVAGPLRDHPAEQGYQVNLVCRMTKPQRLLILQSPSRAWAYEQAQRLSMAIGVPIIDQTLEK